MIMRLEKAFKRQKEFTSDASHELRAPLAIIEAESTLALKKERSVEEFQCSLQMISREVKHMVLIIDQLLALARADSGKESFKFKDIELAEMIKELCSDAEILAREKDIIMRTGCIEHIVTKGDTRSLKTLAFNILSNAIRYTPNGGQITVSLLKKGSTAVLSISDTGVGIPRDDLPFIFEKFYRVDKARSRLEGGSGLGLAICKHIVEVHGGRIEVESQVGEGTTFYVYLPLNVEDGP